jgi:hypothetical protein
MTASTQMSNVRQNHRYDKMPFARIKKLYVYLAPLFSTHTTCTSYNTARSSNERASSVEIRVCANTISSLSYRCAHFKVKCTTNNLKFGRGGNTSSLANSTF